MNVTLVIREKMEANALSAVSTNTKQAWGLVFALIVHPTLRRQLAAFQRRPVNVTLGMREKMEAYVLSAVSTNTKQAWGLIFALIVHRTLRHQLEA